MLKKLIVPLVSASIILGNLAITQAQGFTLDELPLPGGLVNPSQVYSPLVLKGLIIEPLKPLEFKFIVDAGNSASNEQLIRNETLKLMKYFLAGLTIPPNELWVNLSPYEKNRIITPFLGQTVLGRDLLAQDYVLKQLSASLIYPKRNLGRKFWEEVYARVQHQFGTTEIPVNTFNKVWILPDQAQVYEKGNMVYVTKATLKVMMDRDYLAQVKHSALKDSNISSEVAKKIILPAINKEVNSGRNFASLRQIYDAMILAKWYKETIQNGLLTALYTNKNKIAGINLSDPQIKDKIYQRYLQAYKKGVFNFIADEPASNGQLLLRKYFSGGVAKLESMDLDRAQTGPAPKSNERLFEVTMDLRVDQGDPAMMEHVRKYARMKGKLFFSSQQEKIKFFKETMMHERDDKDIALAAAAYLDRNLPDAESTYRMALEADSPDVRAWAARKFLSLRRWEVVSTLLANDDPGVRQVALKFLIHNSNISVDWEINVCIFEAANNTHPDVLLWVMRELYLLNDGRRSIKGGQEAFNEAKQKVINLNYQAELVKQLAQYEKKEEYLLANEVLMDLYLLGDKRGEEYYYDFGFAEKLDMGPDGNFGQIKWHPKFIKISRFDPEHPGIKYQYSSPYHVKYMDARLDDSKDFASLSEKGGIDLNQININRRGSLIKIKFDPAQMLQIEAGGFTGFAPVIVEIKRINSLLPLFGPSSNQ